MNYIESLPLELQYKILVLIPPQHVLNIFRTNKYFNSMCNDTDFWIYRSNVELGTLREMFTEKICHPKIRYLELLSTLGKKSIPGSEYFISITLCFRRCCKYNDINTLNYFIKILNYNNKYETITKKFSLLEGIIGAVKGNHLDLMVDMIKLNEACKYDISDYYIKNALRYSIKNNNINIIKYLLTYAKPRFNIKRYKKILKSCSYNAAKYNNEYIIDYIRTLGYYNPNIIMNGAAMGNNIKLIKYAVNKGANSYNSALINAVDGGDINIIDYIINLGADDLYDAISQASQSGNLHCLMHLMNKLTESGKKLDIDIDSIIRINLCNDYNNLDIVKYLITLRPKNLDLSIEKACEKDHSIFKLLIDYAFDNNILNYKILVNVLVESLINNNIKNAKYLSLMGVKINHHIDKIIQGYDNCYIIELLQKGIQSEILSKDIISEFLSVSKQYGLIVLSHELVNIQL